MFLTYKNIQKRLFNSNIYVMKANEIMKKYNITRNTLSNWVKRGWINIEIMPSGRYTYLDKNNLGDEKM